MGYRSREIADALLTNEVQPERPVISDLQKLRQNTVIKIVEQQRKDKARFDKRRKCPTNYKPGDLVLVKKQKIGEGSKKLQQNYKGPFEVLKVLPRDRYVVADLHGTHRTRGHHLESVEMAEKLRRWNPGENISSSSEEEVDYADTG